MVVDCLSLNFTRGVGSKGKGKQDFCLSSRGDPVAPGRPLKGKTLGGTAQVWKHFKFTCEIGKFPHCLNKQRQTHSHG